VYADSIFEHEVRGAERRTLVTVVTDTKEIFDQAHAVAVLR
jgi:hypothetical protein